MRTMPSRRASSSSVVRHAQTNLPGEFLGRRPGDDILAGLRQSLAAQWLCKSLPGRCIQAISRSRAASVTTENAASGPGSRSKTRRPALPSAQADCSMAPSASYRRCVAPRSATGALPSRTQAVRSRCSARIVQMYGLGLGCCWQSKGLRRQRPHPATLADRSGPAIVVPPISRAPSGRGQDAGARLPHRFDLGGLPGRWRRLALGQRPAWKGRLHQNGKIGAGFRSSGFCNEKQEK